MTRETSAEKCNAPRAYRFLPLELEHLQVEQLLLLLLLHFTFDHVVVGAIELILTKVHH